MVLQEKDSKCPAKHYFAYNNPKISFLKFFRLGLAPLRSGQIQYIFKKFDIIQLFVDIYRAVHRCWLCYENIHWYLVEEASIHARKSATNKF